MIMSNALFKVGDIVRIIDCQHGLIDMFRQIGLITSIKEIGIDGGGIYWYHLNDCRWHWREDWLEAVSKRGNIELML